jgi:coenzyme F420-0:L-glutamate ligase
MIVQPIQTRVFKEKEDLIPFILDYVPILKECSILVVTSKIVALAEGRTVPLGTDEDKEKIIRSESEFALHTEHTWLTIKDGTVMASAGIDESNASGKMILLPRDSFDSAEQIRTALCAHFGLKELGVLITDSRILPLRAGVVGVALGYAGFGGVKDYRGTPDIFGRILKMSRVDIADSLATAAVVVMGEGSEQQPLAIINDAPVEWCEHVDRNELKIDLKDDMYRPLFEHV